MEVLAVGASIAGLLSLTAQCLSGAHHLQELWKDAASIETIVEGFNKDVNILIRTLVDVDSLLHKVQASSSRAGLDDVSLSTLKIQLEDCNSDLPRWISEAQDHEHLRANGDSHPLKRKRFWSSKPRRINATRKAIRTRRYEIEVSLTVLGRLFDVNLAIKADGIVDQLNASEGTSQRMLAEHTATQEKLDRLEALSLSISQSIRSLSSAQSSRSVEDAEPREKKRRRSRSSLRSSKGSNIHTTSSDHESVASSHSDDWLTSSVWGKVGPLLTDSILGDVSHWQHMEEVHSAIASTPGRRMVEIPKYLHDFHEASMDGWAREFRHACLMAGFEDDAESPAPPPDDISKLSVVATGSSGWNETSVPAEEDEPASDSNDDDDDDTSGSLLTSSWDSSLLCEWHSDRDRINRWLLHRLGCVPKEQALLRQTYQSIQKAPNNRRRLNDRAFNRSVLKFWFADEAAVNINVSDVIMASDHGSGIADNEDCSLVVPSPGPSASVQSGSALRDHGNDYHRMRVLRRYRTAYDSLKSLREDHKELLRTDPRLFDPQYKWASPSWAKRKEMARLIGKKQAELDQLQVQCDVLGVEVRDDDTTSADGGHSQSDS